MTDVMEKICVDATTILIKEGYLLELVWGGIKEGALLFDVNGLVDNEGRGVVMEITPKVAMTKFYESEQLRHKTAVELAVLTRNFILSECQRK